MEYTNHIKIMDEDCDKGEDYLTKLERENELLRKQQVKYRNIVNNHIHDKVILQGEIDKLINENIKLTDDIKELRMRCIN